MPKRIIITGTSGFLGHHIAEHFAAQIGHEIISLAGRAQLSALDGKTLGAVETIVHAGFAVDFSPSCPGLESTNLIGVRKVCELAALTQAKHVIFLGAAGALGVSTGPRTRNESDLATTDPGFEAYLHTRYIQEKILSEQIFAERLSCPLTVLYLTTVYGPGMSKETAGFLRAARSPSPLQLAPPGGTSYLGLADFLGAMSLVLENRPAGGFLLSSGNTTFAGLFALAHAIAGSSRRKKILTLPPSARNALRFAAKGGAGKLLTGAVLESAFGYKYYSPEKARRELGWAPSQNPKEILALV